MESTSSTVMAEADERVNRERNLKTKSSKQVEKANYIRHLRKKAAFRPSRPAPLFFGWSSGLGGTCGRVCLCFRLRTRGWLLGRLFRLGWWLDACLPQRSIDYRAYRFFRRSTLHPLAVDEQGRRGFHAELVAFSNGCAYRRRILLLDALLQLGSIHEILVAQITGELVE